MKYWSFTFWQIKLSDFLLDIITVALENWIKSRGKTAQEMESIKVLFLTLLI